MNYCNELKKISDFYESIELNFAHEDRELYLRFCSNIRIMDDSKVCKEMFIQLMKIRFLNSLLNNDENQYQNLKIKGGDYLQQGLFVTIHLGLYQLVAECLCSKGISFCVPVTHYVYKSKKEEYIRRSKNITSGNVIELVDIESASGLIKMIEFIRRGFSILMYIDGNSGVGGMKRTDEKLLEMDFFRKKIMVRKGIAYLSHRFDLPIIPLACIFDVKKLDATIYIYPELDLDANEVNEKNITESVWNLFKQLIYDNAEQWEGWLYVNTFMKDKEKSNYTNYIIDYPFHFNKDRFQFIVKNKKHYLYDLYSNVLISTSEKLFSILELFMKSNISLSLNQIKAKIKKEPLIKDLLSFNILIN